VRDQKYPQNTEKSSGISSKMTSMLTHLLLLEIYVSSWRNSSACWIWSSLCTWQI